MHELAYFRLMVACGKPLFPSKASLTMMFSYIHPYFSLARVFKSPSSTLAGAPCAPVRYLAPPLSGSARCTLRRIGLNVVEIDWKVRGTDTVTLENGKRGCTVAVVGDIGEVGGLKLSHLYSPIGNL